MDRTQRSNNRCQSALAGIALVVSVTAGADDARTLYEDHCRKCHGTDGTARTVRGYLYFATDFTQAAWQAKRSDADILRVIGDGPGRLSAMPAFRTRLSAEERNALLLHVRGFAAPAR